MLSGASSPPESSLSPHSLTQGSLQSKATLESLSFIEAAGKTDEMLIEPKKKVFQSSEERRKYVQEYRRKFKTELCKTFAMTGFCRYGDTCSFAHGARELKEKSHLHSNYKTKPCHQYFERGYCNYGQRCQYLHTELRYVMQFRDFLLRTYETHELGTGKFQKMTLESLILEQMESNFLRSRTLEEFFSLSSHLPSGRRLKCFMDLTSKNEL